MNCVVTFKRSDEYLENILSFIKQAKLCKFIIFSSNKYYIFLDCVLESCNNCRSKLELAGLTLKPEICIYEKQLNLCFLKEN